jgi:hypothetical protein
MGATAAEVAAGTGERHETVVDEEADEEADDETAVEETADDGRAAHGMVADEPAVAVEEVLAAMAKPDTGADAGDRALECDSPSAAREKAWLRLREPSSGAAFAEAVGAGAACRGEGERESDAAISLTQLSILMLLRSPWRSPTPVGSLFSCSRRAGLRRRDGESAGDALCDEPGVPIVFMPHLLAHRSVLAKHAGRLPWISFS